MSSVSLLVGQVVYGCFDAYGIKEMWTCRKCGVLVPTDTRYLHLEYHLPDHDGVSASWKLGVMPNWARF